MQFFKLTFWHILSSPLPRLSSHIQRTSILWTFCSGMQWGNSLFSIWNGVYCFSEFIFIFHSAHDRFCVLFVIGVLFLTIYIYFLIHLRFKVQYIHDTAKYVYFLFWSHRQIGLILSFKSVVANRFSDSQASVFTYHRGHSSI